MKVPVLFIIFNRPDIAEKTFEAIRQYQPDKLYIAADGPRESRSDDKELCKQTRETILQMIDWECEVKTLFREKNIGVDFGVYTAINWLFETEPWGLIVEDDCIISQDFFKFCEVAFPKYKDDPKVMHIASNNVIAQTHKSHRIVFSYYPMTWGWGTWADKWNRVMDTDMPLWKEVKLLNLLGKYGLLGFMYYKYWKTSYRLRHEIKPWDNIWQFSVMMNNGVSLMPEVNLSYNNGIGTSDGTHYKKGEKNFFEGLKVGTLKEPYVFPESYIISKEIINGTRDYFFALRWFGLKKKICKLLK